MSVVDPNPQRELPWTGRKLHLVGIGGAGMSGLARMAAQLGATVSGSDRVVGDAAASLADLGIEVFEGHEAGNLPAGAELVYSSAIPDGSPERREASARGSVQLHRSELLGEMTAMKPTIAVTGTHGKTTTTAMVLAALRAGGLEPGHMIGATLSGGEPSAGWGKGDRLVIEADESDRSLLNLEVEIAVLTNCELDHHATYSSLDDLRATLGQFLGAARTAVVWDRPDLVALVPASTVCVPCDASDVDTGGGIVSFSWRDRPVALKVPGAHNAINAALALEAAFQAGCGEEDAIRGVESFAGTGRRFERVGVSPVGAGIIDDYAHHPTEVAATIAAARTLDADRVVAAFQPHLYSRTAAFAEEFASALAAADRVLLLDVYPARERAEDFPGVDSRLIARAEALRTNSDVVDLVGDTDQAVDAIRAELREGDLLLLMGAGDIGTLAARLAA